MLLDLLTLLLLLLFIVFLYLLKIRKEERRIKLENIINEKIEERKYIQKWLDEFCSYDFSTLDDANKLVIRSRLVTKIDLENEREREILRIIDNILEQNKRDHELIKGLQEKISLILIEEYQKIKFNEPFFLGAGDTIDRKSNDYNNYLKTENYNSAEYPTKKSNISYENFDEELTKELCTQVTLLPLFISVVIIFHKVGENNNLNLDGKVLNILAVIILSSVFFYIFLGVLDRKGVAHWVKFNIKLIILFLFLIGLSLKYFNDLNVKLLEPNFIIITSMLASVYTVVAFRSLNNFLKKVEEYRLRFFVLCTFLAIEFYIILSAFTVG